MMKKKFPEKSLQQQLDCLKKTLSVQRQAQALAIKTQETLQAQQQQSLQSLDHAYQGVTPLKRHNQSLHLSKTPPVAKPLSACADAGNEQNRLMSELSDLIDVDTLLDTDESLSFCQPGIGRDVLRKLRQGHWVIQHELDLHGMRVEQAREAVNEFIIYARQQHYRCLRIIHGKGWGSKDRLPVLKDKVKGWLIQKEEVLAFCQARPSDGGAGAVLVLIVGR
jgi:DNA-nicking Smr family endonuclease